MEEQEASAVELSEHHRSQFAVAVYGIISVAVLVAVWEPEGSSWELSVLAALYALAIWLAHSFANVMSRGPTARWRVALDHEKWVMVGAIPVVVVGLLGELFDWSPDTADFVAFASLLVLLIAVQLLLLRVSPPHQRRLGATLALDVAAFLIIVILLAAVH
jgi:hypothetical protein